MIIISSVYKLLNKFLFLFLIFILSSSIFSDSLKSNEKNLQIKNILNADYISLNKFAEALELHNSYDIITGRGKLLYKSYTATYQTGLSIIIINGELEKSKTPVIAVNGEIFIPIELIKKISSEFNPFITLVKDKNILNIVYKDDVPKQKPAKEEDKPAKTAEIKDKITFLIIDPGHGGKDPGAIGVKKVKEKNITLSVSKYLEEFLNEKLKGVNIKLTRNSDKFLELATRTGIANKMLKANHNGLFISVHVNASIIQNASGFETYFLSQNPSNEEARKTAALENNVIILEEKSKSNTYDDIDNIEALMITTQIQKESSMLAQSVQQSMSNKIKAAKSNGVKKADFFVLRGSLMPAVLAEIGYITNKKESKNLTDKAYQKKVAESIGYGIIEFIKKYNASLKN